MHMRHGNKGVKESESQRTSGFAITESCVAPPPPPCAKSQSSFSTVFKSENFCLHLYGEISDSN